MSTRVQLALMMLACLPLAACGFYSAEPITVRVVDADTGAAIDGANVVAAWEVYGGLENGNVEGFVQVMETATNKDGRFHFPAWGPRLNTHFSEIRNASAPVVMVFKSGYHYRAVGNTGKSGAPAPSEMKSDWNGKTIALQRFHGSSAEYKASFIQLTTDVSTLVDHGELPEIPTFLCALAFQDEALAADGIPNALYSFRELRRRGVTCPGREEKK
jgi:hypothetical protein